MEQKKNLVLELTIGIVTLLIGIGCAVAAYILNFDHAKEWYIYLLYIGGAVLMFIGVCLTYRFLQDRRAGLRKFNVRQMTLVAFMSAITIVLYYYAKFNLPFFPPWMDVQVSEIPAVITSFIYGPAAGCLVIFIRFITKLPGTITAGVGEVGDLFLGFILVIVSGLIYKKHRTFKGAVFSMISAVLASTVAALFVNWLILIPAYINIAGFPMASLVSSLDKIYAFKVTEDNFMISYIFIGVLPFNLFRYIIVIIVTFVLYKRTHWLFDKISGVNVNKDDDETNNEITDSDFSNKNEVITDKTENEEVTENNIDAQ